MTLQAVKNKELITKEIKLNDFIEAAKDSIKRNEIVQGQIIQLTKKTLDRVTAQDYSRLKRGHKEYREDDLYWKIIEKSFLHKIQSALHDAGYSEDNKRVTELMLKNKYDNIDDPNLIADIGGFKEKYNSSDIKIPFVCYLEWLTTESLLSNNTQEQEDTRKTHDESEQKKNPSQKDIGDKKEIEIANLKSQLGEAKATIANNKKEIKAAKQAVKQADQAVKQAEQAKVKAENKVAEIQGKLDDLQNKFDQLSNQSKKSKQLFNEENVTKSLSIVLNTNVDDLSIEKVYELLNDMEAQSIENKNVSKTLDVLAAKYLVCKLMMGD